MSKDSSWTEHHTRGVCAEKEKKIGKKEKEMYTLVNKRRYSSHTFRYGYLVTT
jgi:hypothetical protein